MSKKRKIPEWFHNIIKKKIESLPVKMGGAYICECGYLFEWYKCIVPCCPRCKSEVKSELKPRLLWDMYLMGKMQILAQYDPAKYDRVKDTYWEHYLCLTKYWGHGFTTRRLQKIRPYIMADKSFWLDVFRHVQNNETPEEMKERDIDVYRHCFGNISGMLMQTFVEKKIIR